MTNTMRAVVPTPRPIGGVVSPDSGSISMRDETLRQDLNQRDAILHGIGIVQQERGLVLG